MVIRFIEKGTVFDVVVLAENLDSSIELNGSLYEIKQETSLLIEGNELYGFCAKQPPGLRLSLTFFRGAQKFSFQGKFERTLSKHGVRLTEITATTGIEETNRRSVPRLRSSMEVKLYLQTENNTAELICIGETYDISSNAICFLSNGNISVPDNSTFSIEFVLYKRDCFNLPAKLARRGNAPQSVRYKYDYALVFDFSENPNEKNRLVYSFFKNSMERRYL